MPPVITKSTVSFLVIFSLPSVTMRSEYCLILLLVCHLSCCHRLGKLLGDVVISQGGVGEYRSGLFYLISDSFVQFPTSRLNFYQQRRAKERRKVKRLSRSWASYLLYLLCDRLVLYCISSYITQNLASMFFGMSHMQFKV